jgi:hypothetical protein
MIPADAHDNPRQDRQLRRPDPRSADRVRRRGRGRWPAAPQRGGPPIGWSAVHARRPGPRGGHDPDTRPVRSGRTPAAPGPAGAGGAMDRAAPGRRRALQGDLRPHAAQRRAHRRRCSGGDHQCARGAARGRLRGCGHHVHGGVARIGHCAHTTLGQRGPRSQFPRRPTGADRRTDAVRGGANGRGRRRAHMVARPAPPAVAGARPLGCVRRPGRVRERGVRAPSSCRRRFSRASGCAPSSL